MHDYFKPKAWAIMVLMFLAAFSLSSAIVYYEFAYRQNIKVGRASAGDNASGWAWNANIGWISFNCTNDNPPCVNSDYGVSIDPGSGNFSGYAWSPSVGWISFNRNDVGDPPGQPYRDGTILAHYNDGDGQVNGWAKILTLGDNGWIKLRKFSSDDGGDYGVSIDAAGNFSGWAWNANTDGSGIGWISFNCANDSSCAASDYKVIAIVNRPPAVTDMTAPNRDYSQASCSQALGASLSFRFDDQDAGSFGSAYQVVLTKEDGTSVLDTERCTGYQAPSAKCKFDVNCLVNSSACQYLLATELAYGTSYQWWAKVWDDHNVGSALTPYTTSPDSPPIADDGKPLTFTTYLHEFPRPSASYLPSSPSRGEEIKFTDASQRFFSAPPAPDTPATPFVCNSATCEWKWTVPAGATIDNDAIPTPTIIFGPTSSNIVKLRVTDKTDTGSTPYYCEIEINVDLKANLPKWLEVKPDKPE
jgi:hypothetical protein